MTKNELYVVKEYELDNPFITDEDSILDSCFKDCHNNHFHKFKYKCIFDIKLTNNAINEIINLTISGKSMKKI